MSWTKSTPNKMLLGAELAIALPDTTTSYSSEINFIRPNFASNNRYVTFVATWNGSKVGTNLDFALYGAWTEGGTKFLLVDTIIADMTAVGTSAGVVDLNAYPAPYYYVSVTTDNTETGTLDLHIAAQNGLSY